MADQNKNFRVLTTPTAATGPDGLPGTPIIAPIDCSLVVIENMDGTNAQNVYADETEGGSFKVVPSTIELTLRFSSSGDPVIQRGERVCRVAPAAGTGPVTVTFFR